MIVYDCLLFCNGNGQESSPIQSAPKAKGGVNQKCFLSMCFSQLSFIREDGLCEALATNKRRPDPVKNKSVNPFRSLTWPD